METPEEKNPKNTPKKSPTKPSTSKSDSSVKNPIEAKASIKKVSPKTTTDSIKRKAKSEVQKNAAKAKNSTKTSTKIITPQASVKKSDSSSSKKHLLKEEIFVPKRKDIRGIPSAKLNVFNKATSSTSANKESKKPEDGELDLKVKSSLKKDKEIEIKAPSSKSPSTPEKKKTVTTDTKEPSKPKNTQAPKVLKAKERDKTPPKSTKSSTVDTKPPAKKKVSSTNKTKTNKTKTTNNKTKKKKVNKTKPGKKPTKKTIKKKIKINKKLIIIIVLIILVLLFSIYKIVDKKRVAKVENTTILETSSIVEPKFSAKLDSDFIYVGDSLQDIETLSANINNLDSDNSIFNIEDNQLSDDYIRLNIVKGLSATAISKVLEEKGVCDSTEFLNYVVENKLETNLKSGLYLIKKNSSIKEIVTSIVASDSTTIKIYPASTIDQVDKLLTNRSLIKGGEFLSACTKLCKEKGLSFVEGWFTPATYKITNSFDVDLLASTMLINTFKTLSPYLSDIAKSGYSIDDIIVIASLIQGETQDEKQMPIISSVIHNRLKSDMPLGIDATSRYEVGDWSIELTKDILDNQTPYNTRRKKGLPPSGICLSSKVALVSAIYPLESDYMYYLHDKDGILIPAYTYEEHLENIDKRDNK